MSKPIEQMSDGELMRTITRTRNAVRKATPPAMTRDEIARSFGHIPVGQLTDAQVAWAFADRLSRNDALANEILDQLRAGIFKEPVR